jgi:hypothetical protein
MTSHLYDVRIILASVNPWGGKIASIVARYPRFIHSELMTHKDLVRNASSSRAIPFRKMLKITREGMAAPIYWGKNQPGMSAAEELKGLPLWWAKFMWYATGHIVLTCAWLMSFSGVHKQIINRMIEPWTYINVMITATNFERMLKLRIDAAAQPEFQLLANMIKVALANAHYQRLKMGEWHLPWIRVDEQQTMYLTNLKKISAARCARLSYTPIGDVKTNLKKDMTLSRDLLEQLHLSPFEHQATPAQGRYAAFDGWSNYRTELRY